MASRRAVRKKMRRRFQVGDVVTWGLGVLAHRVLEVRAAGLVVDTTSSGLGAPRPGGRLVRFVEFCPPSRSYRCPGPPWHATFPPDEDPAGVPPVVQARRIAEAARRRAAVARHPVLRSPPRGL